MVILRPEHVYNLVYGEWIILFTNMWGYVYDWNRVCGMIIGSYSLEVNNNSIIRHM